MGLAVGFEPLLLKHEHRRPCPSCLCQEEPNQAVPQTVQKSTVKSFEAPVHTLADTQLRLAACAFDQAHICQVSSRSTFCTFPSIYTGRSPAARTTRIDSTLESSQPRTQVRKQLRHSALQPQAAPCLRKLVPLCSTSRSTAALRQHD